jgi:hypothetical protein
MLLRLLVCAALLFSVAGCKTLEAPYKKKDEDEKKPMKDQSGDQTFMAFLGRLRIAVSKHDKAVLASMMTADFGWRWDTPPPGETPFAYWDQQNTWGDLQQLLKKQFVPNGNYMVAPPQVVTDKNYAGFRIGLRTEGGSWKIAYFVPAEVAGH